MMASNVTKKMPRPFAILRIKSGPPPRINSARQPAHNEPARCPRSIRTWEWVPRGFPWLVHRIPHSGVRRGFDECADYFSFMGAHKQVEPRLGVDSQRVLSRITPRWSSRTAEPRALMFTCWHYALSRVDAWRGCSVADIHRPGLGQ